MGEHSDVDDRLFDNFLNFVCTIALFQLVRFNLCTIFVQFGCTYLSFGWNSTED